MPMQHDSVRHPPQPTATTVTSPASLGDGNFDIINAQTDAVLTLGNGNSMIRETAAGATITVGNGNDRITDTGGTASIVGGAGDMQITLGGKSNSVTLAGNAGGDHDWTTVIAGQGNDSVSIGAGNAIVLALGGGSTVSLGSGLGAVEVSGAANSVTTGSGTHLVVAGDRSDVISADTITLGAGTNTVFLGGSGNTVYDGSGTDEIFASRVGNDSFVINAAGGTDTIHGFSPTNGDVLDLSKLLAGTAVDSDLSNIASFVTLTTDTHLHHGGSADTVLTVQGAAASANITLANTGTLTLADLVSDKSLLA